MTMNEQVVKQADIEKKWRNHAERTTAAKTNAGDISFRSFSFLHLLVLKPNEVPLIPRTGSSSKTLYST